MKMCRKCITISSKIIAAKFQKGFYKKALFYYFQLNAAWKEKYFGTSICFSIIHRCVTHLCFLSFIQLTNRLAKLNSINFEIEKY